MKIGKKIATYSIGFVLLGVAMWTAWAIFMFVDHLFWFTVYSLTQLF